MPRVRCGIVKKTVREEEAANNVGSGNVAMPVPVIKWKDDKKLLQRASLEGKKKK